MNQETKKQDVSLSNGFWFYFDHEGMQIAAHGSALSGKETIFVDSEIVSAKRSFSRSSHHDFTHNGHNYQVIFFMESILKGILSCSLYKDGELVSTTSKSYPMKPFNWKSFWLALAAGFIVGYCAVWLGHR